MGIGTVVPNARRTSEQSQVRPESLFDSCPIPLSFSIDSLIILVFLVFVLMNIAMRVFLINIYVIIIFHYYD